MISNPPKIIVALGNFGHIYENTYHNVGWIVLDEVLKELGADCSKKECSSLTAHVLIDGKKSIFAKPQTYMNLSGTAVRELANKYKVDYSDVLVICDDIDLPIGSLRIRSKGSGGTHNGLRDIVLKCGENFNRLRVGIGRPMPPMQLVDYVLSKIKTENLEKLTSIMNLATQGIIDFAAGDDVGRIGCRMNR